MDEFTKIDVKVGKIVSAERVPGSKKLLKLQVDIGGELKQCIAGLADQYSSEEMTNKLVAVVTNLQKKKIFNLESEVMLLAAVDGPTVGLLQPDRPFPPGSNVM